MTLRIDTYSIATRGDLDIVDLTPFLEGSLRKHAVSEGVVSLFIQGSTAALTTIEFEPSLLQDFRNMLSNVIPRKGWSHPENAHSHLRASMLGPSLTIPISAGMMVLGAWQQPVLVEMDTRPRDRRVVVAVYSE